MTFRALVRYGLAFVVTVYATFSSPFTSSLRLVKNGKREDGFVHDQIFVRRSASSSLKDRQLRAGRYTAGWARGQLNLDPRTPLSSPSQYNGVRQISNPRVF